MTSLSFLDIIAADESDVRLASRKTIVSAKQRIEDRFGDWLRQSSSKDDFNERVSYIEDDLKGIIAQAAEEHGGAATAEDYQNYFRSILENYAPELAQAVEARTASVHEARKVKMCPWHKDVVDISLAAGDPRAGFDSMAQHWGGPRHCEGEGYEGSKCNFKAPMTTQSWWDDKAEKAEQRKKDRALQAELPEVDDILGDEIIDEPVDGDTIIEEPSATEEIETPSEGAEIIEFPVGEATEAPVEAEIPMSMAAKTADKDITGLGEVSGPAIDKRLWTPQSVPFLDDVDDSDGPHPTKRKDVVEPIKPQNSDKLEEIGEQETKRVDLDSDTENAGFSDGGETSGGPTKTWTQGPATAVASTLPDDIHKNPIKAIIEGEYDGFLPAHTVQQAIAAYRK